MKKRLPTILLILFFLAGLSLLLYPTISDYWNSLHQSKAISHYVEAVANMDEEEYERIWNSAIEYNEKLYKNSSRHKMTEKDKKEYQSHLNIADNGIMGYIEIPSISCTLPIYHGTSDAVLQIAVGHIEGTSLPVGGKSSHCVLSGHRGLPSAKLFTNLDKLIEGDIFMLRVLDNTLTYEVDDIKIVEPHEVDGLDITYGKDYCTLVTCTPYGVNTHRLLVRGRRIENIEEASTAHITSDAMQIEPVIIAPIVAVPIIIVLIIVVMSKDRRSRRRD